MSKYNNIETANGLIQEVISHGLSTEQDDLNRAADIFGNSKVGELAALANSKETVSGKQISDIFYFIAFRIWNWRDAVSFYNEHTSEERRLRLEAENKFNAQVKANEELLADVVRLDETVAELKAQTYAALEEVETQEKRAEEAEAAVVVLKARLYDLMMPESEGE